MRGCRPSAAGGIQIKSIRSSWPSRVQGASAAATEAVQKAGGSVVVMPQIGRATREEVEHKTSGSLRKTKKAAKAEAAKS